MAKTSYAIALGSNRRSCHGSPQSNVRAAAEALQVERLSSIRSTAALGPAGRGFANAAALISSPLSPAELLDDLKALERSFGRRAGRRWGPRVLDLDIILWSGGLFDGAGLTVPHPSFRERLFVLDPLVDLTPGWRDPITGLTIRQLLHRLRAASPVDPRPAQP